MPRRRKDDAPLQGPVWEAAVELIGSMADSIEQAQIVGYRLGRGKGKLLIHGTAVPPSQRQRVMAYIAENPGRSITQIARATGIKNGSVSALVHMGVRIGTLDVAHGRGPRGGMTYRIRIVAHGEDSARCTPPEPALPAWKRLRLL